MNSASFDIKKEAYITTNTSFQQPKEIAHFSYDANRNLLLNDDSALVSHFADPNLRRTLCNVGSPITEIRESENIWASDFHPSSLKEMLLFLNI